MVAQSKTQVDPIGCSFKAERNHFCLPETSKKNRVVLFLRPRSSDNTSKTQTLTQKTLIAVFFVEKHGFFNYMGYSTRRKVSLIEKYFIREKYFFKKRKVSLPTSHRIKFSDFMCLYIEFMCLYSTSKMTFMCLYSNFSAQGKETCVRFWPFSLFRFSTRGHTTQTGKDGLQKGWQPQRNGVSNQVSGNGTLRRH